MDESPNHGTNENVVSSTTGPAICPNCGTDFQGAFCSSCGQKDEPLRQSTYHFVRDALVELFGIDGRLWVSIFHLFARPGSLTAAYVNGQRRKYIRPFRLYLSATILFFFLVSFYDPIGKAERKLSERVGSDSTATVQERIDIIGLRLHNDERRIVREREKVGSARVLVDSLRSASVPVDSSQIAKADEKLRRAESSLAESTYEVDVRRKRFEWQRGILQTYPPDSTIAPHDLADASNHVFPGPGGGGSTMNVNLGLPDWAVRNPALLRMRDAKDNRELVAAQFEFLRGMIGRIPAVMFVLLPGFALLMKLLYARGRLSAITRPIVVAVSKAANWPAPQRGAPAWFYTEHLVFGLHTHAFTFLVFSVVALVVGFVGVTAVSMSVIGLLAVWVSLYYLFAMRRVYGQGWIKTIFKASILVMVYQFFLMTMGLVLAMLLTAALG